MALRWFDNEELAKRHASARGLIASNPKTGGPIPFCVGTAAEIQAHRQILTMKRVWCKSTPADRLEFLKWVVALGGGEILIEKLGGDFDRVSVDGTVLAGEFR